MSDLTAIYIIVGLTILMIILIILSVIQYNRDVKAARERGKKFITRIIKPYEQRTIVERILYNAFLEYYIKGSLPIMYLGAVTAILEIEGLFKKEEQLPLPGKERERRMKLVEEYLIEHGVISKE